MKIKVEFQKGVDEHKLGKIVDIRYKWEEYYREDPLIELTDIDGKTLIYCMSDILMLSVEE
jgi:hypothetical protein